MLRTEAASPAELAQLHRENRIENRAYASAQDRAAADPCRTYRCCECGETEDALNVAWWGNTCDCGGLLIGQPVVQLRNPVTGNASVTLKASAL
jgi:hypothetical protein